MRAPAGMRLLRNAAPRRCGKGAGGKEAGKSAEKARTAMAASRTEMRERRSLLCTTGSAPVGYHQSPRDDGQILRQRHGSSCGERTEGRWAAKRKRRIITRSGSSPKRNGGCDWPILRPATDLAEARRSRERLTAGSRAAAALACGGRRSRPPCSSPSSCRSSCTP